MSSFQDFLTYLSPLVLLLGSIIGIFSIQRISPVSKVLLMYLIVSFITDIISRILLESYGNNLIVLLVYSAIELLMISCIYGLLKTEKWVVILLTSMGIAYIIGEIIYIDSYDVDTFQTYTKIVSSFILVIFSFRYFLDNLVKEQIIQGEVQWLNFTILFYFALNIILLLPLNLLINQSETSIVFTWYAYLIATVAFYSYLSIFIWKNGRIQTQ